MEFLFGWLPFGIPLWVGDYLIIGLLIATSVVRGMQTSGEMDQLKEGLEPFFKGHLQNLKHKALTVFMTAWYAIIAMVLWPAAIYFGPEALRNSAFHAKYVAQFPEWERQYEKRRHDEEGLTAFDELVKGSFYWLLAILLGFVVLLAVNSQLTTA